MHTDWIVFAVFAAVWGFAGYTIASSRERNRLIGTLVGFGLGLIGVLIYAFVTRKPKTAARVPTELAPIP